MEVGKKKKNKSSESGVQKSVGLESTLLCRRFYGRTGGMTFPTYDGSFTGSV